MHKQIFTSSIWMFLGSALQQILQFVVFILLARLLTPDVFGQVALASVVIDIALALSIWGVNDLMIQRRVVTNRLISQVFYLSLTIACIMSVLIAGGVGVYVWLNDSTIVTKLILMLVPIIIVQGFGIVPDIIIKRDLDFKWLAIRNNLAALIGGGVALLFAYMGFGIYALVIQKLVALVVLSSSVWMAIISKKKTFKLYRFSVRSMLIISRHSLQLLAGAMSGLLSVRAMDGLVGLFLGTTILGQYKIVWRIYDMLMQLAITPVSSVAFAAFPKFMHRPEELRKLYHNMLSISLIVYLPTFTGIAYTAKDWVPIVLGEKWLEIIPLMHVMVLASIVTVFIFFQNALLLSYRKNQFLFKQNIFKVLLVAGVTFVTAHYDIRLVILGFVGVYLGLVLWNTQILHGIHRWKRVDDLKSLVPAFFCTTMMVFTLFGFDHFVPLQMQGLRLAVDAGMGAVVYALSFLIFFPERTSGMFNFLKNIRKVTV